MGTPIDIWLVGNTGLRNPNRIKDGFSVFAESSFVGNLRGRENDIAFMNLLNEKGIIQNEGGNEDAYYLTENAFAFAASATIPAVSFPVTSVVIFCAPAPYQLLRPVAAQKER